MNVDGTWLHEWQFSGGQALSITVESSHLIGWWSFQMYSATADVPRVPLWQASWCSISLVLREDAWMNIELNIYIFEC